MGHDWWARQPALTAAACALLLLVLLLPVGWPALHGAALPRQDALNLRKLPGSSSYGANEAVGCTKPLASGTGLLLADMAPGRPGVSLAPA